MPTTQSLGVNCSKLRRMFGGSMHGTHHVAQSSSTTLPWYAVNRTACRRADPFDQQLPDEHQPLAGRLSRADGGPHEFVVGRRLDAASS
jgi:hypothetical protein